jgi:hypothetical protein
MASTNPFCFSRVGLLDILLAQILFFFVARPTDEILTVAGHDRRWANSGLASCAPLALVRQVD